MAIRKIVEMGKDDILRKHSRRVTKFDRRLAVLLDDMAETMYEADGVGLAAPQVGVLRRVVAVQRFDKQGEPFEFFLNPEILGRSSATQFGGEGCLSVPDLSGNVERAEWIVLRYRDEEWREHQDTIRGFTAVIFQHEVDHLYGRLFIDYLK